MCNKSMPDASLVGRLSVLEDEHQKLEDEHQKLKEELAHTRSADEEQTEKLKRLIVTLARAESKRIALIERQKTDERLIYFNSMLIRELAMLYRDAALARLKAERDRLEAMGALLGELASGPLLRKVQERIAKTMNEVAQTGASSDSSASLEARIIRIQEENDKDIQVLEERYNRSIAILKASVRTDGFTEGFHVGVVLGIVERLEAQIKAQMGLDLDGNSVDSELREKARAAALHLVEG